MDPQSGLSCVRATVGRVADLESELRASRDALRLALEAGRMGTWSWDLVNNEVVWDDMTCTLFDVESAPPDLEQYLECLHPDDRDLAHRTVQEALQERRGYSLVHRVTRQGGEVRWLEGRADVILDDAGEPCGLRGVTIDVTEREEASRQLRRLAAHNQLLAAAGVELAATLDPDQVLRRAAELVVPELADGCDVALLQADGSVRREVYTLGVDADRLRRRELLPVHIDDDHPVARVLRTGQPLLIDAADDADEHAFGPRTVEGSARSMGIRQAVIAPMMVRGEVIGALALGVGGRRRLDALSVDVASELAARTALCYDNARLFSRERAVAETLQRSLVPPTLPAVEWLDLAGRYSVPGVGVEVGGDFYDAIDEDDAVVLMIGDVCGKGIEAAGLTALARHTLRAAIAHVGDPVVALRWLHDGVRVQTPDSFVTAALVRFRCTTTGALIEAAIGGHPRPILLRRDGTTEVIDPGGSAPGLPIWRPAPLVCRELNAGDTLVLYTDGVTDVPGDAALTTDDLGELVATFAGLSADAMADGLMSRLDALRPQRFRTDDIALVVARVAGS